ncbi:MAG: hypothetical protein AB4911_20425 [Oscillochloridaceae bacterium umkhey_bin13]
MSHRRLPQAARCLHRSLSEPYCCHPSLLKYLALWLLLGILTGCTASTPSAQIPTPASGNPPKATVVVADPVMPRPTDAPLPTAVPTVPAVRSDPVANPEPVPPTAPLGGPRHLVVALDGVLLLQRAPWPAPLAIGFGTPLAAGDLVTLESGSATLVCSDLTVAVVPVGATLRLETDLCPMRGSPRISLPDGQITAMRGRNNAIPYIVSPRFTGVRDDLPLLRWNDTGAPPYTVQVVNDDEEWTRTGITGPSTPYDGQPSLVSGQFYTVIVTDSLGRSSEEELVRGLGFWRIDPAEVAAITAAEDLLMAAKLPPAGAAYARAWLLAGYGLRAEAIAELDALNSVGPDQAAVAIVLGDLYRQLALTLLAEAAYTQARDVAQASDNVLMWATAEAGLGEMLVQLNELDQAMTILAAARERFLTLGDPARAADLAKLITEIESQ